MKDSNEYYLKSGKLELFLLDDEETEQILREKKEQELQNSIKAEQAKKRQSKLKVSREVYNTFQTVGKFIMKQDDWNNDPVAKEQKLKEIASSIKVQEVQLPPAPSKEEILKKITITKSDQILAVDEKVHIPSTGEVANEEMLNQNSEADMTSDEVQFGSTEKSEVAVKNDDAIYARENVEDITEDFYIEELAESRENEFEEITMDKKKAVVKEKVIVERYRPIIEQRNRELLNGEEKFLEQKNIDDIVEDYFKDKHFPYAYSRELKKHIDKQINMIQSYQ